MINSAEQLKSHIAKAEIEGDTLKISTSVHFVAETDESRRKKREIHADRATIARARERNFGGRMLHGLTETYQHLQTREQLRRYHDEGEDISSESAAFDQAKAHVDTLKANEKEEAEALALKTNILPDVSTGDRLYLASEETAGSASQKRIISQARKLVIDFTLGQIDEVTLESKADTIVKLWRRELVRGQDKFYGLSEIGSDIVQVAKVTREAYLGNQEQAVKVDVNLEVYFGSINSGFATQEKRDRADKLIDWTQGSQKRSWLVNPLTIGLGASAGAFAIRVPTKAIPIIGGIAGGIFAGVRRWSKENKDRYLKQREEEIGYEINGPASPGNPIEKVLVVAVGQTDFRESSYQPISALETTERFEELIEVSEDIKQSTDWQNQTLSLIAEIRERIDLSEALEIGLVKFGQIRREDGQIEVTGTSTIDRDKLNLIVSAAIAEKELKTVIGENEFNNRYSAEAGNIREQLLEGIAKADAKFKKSKIFKSLRSGSFASVVGALGGIGVHFAGEGIQVVSEEIADAADDLKEHILEKVKEDVPLGNGKLETITVATKDTPGLKIEVPQGYSHQIDASNHMVVLNGPDGHFEIPYSDHMSESQAKLALETAGLEGKVSAATEIVGGGAHSVQQEILKPDYLAFHNLTEITGKSFHFSFGHAYDVLDPGEHEYNELTLYQHTGFDWSVGPHGLDGSPISPFVYTDEPAWADPAILANAPVNPHDLVAFYQVADETGKWHTILAPQDGGHFQLPSEFIDPQTGKVDGVGIIGYGMVRDANGHIIPADQVLANPDLINSGTLHSMASIPLEQKARVIAEQFEGQIVQIEDLTKTVEKSIDTLVDRDHDFDIDIPPLATPFAPRIFPEVAKDGLVPIYILPPYGYAPEEVKARYRSKLSPTLLENSTAKLNPVEETTCYINSWPENWKQEIEDMDKEIGQPMDPNTQVVVTIPVASHQESRNIKRTLENYVEQKDLQGNVLSPSKFEIILFLNRPKGTRGARTKEKVAEFKKEHPEIKVHVIDRVFKEKPTMGRLRKCLSDLAVKRAKDSGVTGGNLIIVSNDADAVDISEKYIASIANVLNDSRNKSLDAVLGKIEWDPKVLKKYPVFYAANRFMQFLDTTIRHSPEAFRSVCSSGANFAYTSEIYSAIGGYDPTDTMGEDRNLGLMIKLARAGGEKSIPIDRYPFGYLGRAKIVTSARRGLAKYLEGWSVVDQWGDFANADYVRELKLDKQTAQETAEGFSKDRLEREINVTIGAYNLNPETYQVKRALEFLKVDYHIEGGRIKLDSIARLEEMFRRFASQSISQGEIFQDEKEDGDSDTNWNIPRIRTHQEAQDKKKLAEVRAQVRRHTESRATTTASIQPAPIETTATIEKISHPIPSETVEISSEKLIDEVNSHLQQAKADHYIFRVEPNILVKYLQGLSLPAGASFQDLAIKAENNQAELSGALVAAGGTTKFKINLANSPSGKLQVISHTLQPALRHQLFIGQIKSRIANIDSEVAAHLGNQIDDRWQVLRVLLDDNKFAFDIERKLGDGRSQDEERIARQRSVQEAADEKELARVKTQLQEVAEARSRRASEVTPTGSPQGQRGDRKSPRHWAKILAREKAQAKTQKAGDGTEYKVAEGMVSGPFSSRLSLLNPLKRLTKEEARQEFERLGLTARLKSRRTNGSTPKINNDISGELARARERRIKTQRALRPNLTKAG